LYQDINNKQKNVVSPLSADSKREQINRCQKPTTTCYQNEYKGLDLEKWSGELKKT